MLQIDLYFRQRGTKIQAMSDCLDIILPPESTDGNTVININVDTKGPPPTDMQYNDVIDAVSGIVDSWFDLNTIHRLIVIGVKGNHQLTPDESKKVKEIMVNWGGPWAITHFIPDPDPQ